MSRYFRPVIFTSGVVALVAPVLWQVVGFLLGTKVMIATAWLYVALTAGVFSFLLSGIVGLPVLLMLEKFRISNVYAAGIIGGTLAVFIFSFPMFDKLERGWIIIFYFFFLGAINAMVLLKTHSSCSNCSGSNQAK